MEAPSIWGRSISDLSDKDSLAAPARQEGPEDPHTIGVYALTGSAFAECGKDQDQVSVALTALGEAISDFLKPSTQLSLNLEAERPSQRSTTE
ncbi:hypothetical protein G5I_04758 [Acromyrmex echinatior]|uniref:Uncharacterized protein n=1 Tax=Acromyrmex echinatior TaxID=103372 RepID=F4WGH9_ACREC|nr:hypothetical protein G5I_04758 [Acromyrmex echinatior]